MTRDTFDTLSDNRDRGMFGDNELAPPRPKITGKSDLKDFTLCVHWDKPKDRAILLSQTGEEATAHWYARSLIEYRDTGKQTQGKTRKGQSVMLAVVEVAMPEWLAKQNGLV